MILFFSQAQFFTKNPCFFFPTFPTKTYLFKNQIIK
nr:MAG TPA: hypothetical protein [Caudoviricetes sp.]